MSDAKRRLSEAAEKFRADKAVPRTMRRRRPLPDPESPRMHMLCPFCMFPCDRTASLTWCSGCYCEWMRDKNGDTWFVPSLKTERFLWAKVIQKSGGMRIGGDKS
jgi:hypothetical protein